MNQSQMFNKLQNWIDQLITSSQNDFQDNTGETKPFFIDPNRFLFLLSELYEKTNEKERLFTICQIWSHSLLKNIKLEEIEWEQLNRKSKQYETNHFFYFPKIVFKTYQDYCYLLFVLNCELEKFIISIVPQHEQTNENRIEQKESNTTLTIKERLIILQYMQDYIMKITGFSLSEMRWKVFITKLLNINLVSIKKPLEKVNEAMNNDKLTPPEANELFKSYEKIADLFKSVGLSELKEIAEKRTEKLIDISQK